MNDDTEALRARLLLLLLSDTVDPMRDIPEIADMQREQLVELIAVTEACTLETLRAFRPRLH